MNVDEAMAYWKKERANDDTYYGMPEMICDILSAEVERLRGELSAEGTAGELILQDNRDLRIENKRLAAELAKAKAASACPVKVSSIWEGTYQSDRYIELRTDAEADTFTDWLRERMKERGEQ
jgi:hypothetical protein